MQTHTNTVTPGLLEQIARNSTPTNIHTYTHYYLFKGHRNVTAKLASRDPIMRRTQFIRKYRYNGINA